MIAGRTQYELVSAPACCQAVLWEEGETPVNLGSQPAGPLPSVAYAISADGSTIVGNAGGAAMWGVDGSFLQIEYEGSTATAVSADGSVVAGTTSSLQPGTHLFTWTADDGLVLHTDVRAGSQASGVFLSDDGTTVFGGDPTTGLYLWTELAGVEYVPGIDAPAGTIYPTAMSGDGTVLAASSNYVPYVSFDAGGDWVILDDFLLDQGVDLGTWTLWRVTGLSSDGSVLVGYGTVEGDSGLKPFAVFLPEPGAALLCGMAAIALAIGRREHA